MVSNVNRTTKAANVSVAKQDSSGKQSKLSAAAPSDTWINVVSKRLLDVPADQQATFLAQELVSDILGRHLGLKSVNEPEYARLIEKIKTILVSSPDAKEQLSLLLKMVSTQKDV